MLLQGIAAGYPIGEVTCPTRYTADASAIGGWSLMRYGAGVLRESLRYGAEMLGWLRGRYADARRHVDERA